MREWAQAGNKFDSESALAQIHGDQKLLAIQNTYFAASKDLMQIDIAMLAPGMIEQRLTLLADIQKNGMRD